jgi:hypothetical protein
MSRSVQPSPARTGAEAPWSTCGSRVRGEARNGSVYAVGKVSCRRKPVDEAPGAVTGGIAAVSRGSPWREDSAILAWVMAAAGQPAVT